MITNTLHTTIQVLTSHIRPPANLRTGKAERAGIAKIGGRCNDLLRTLSH